MGVVPYNWENLVLYLRKKYRVSGSLNSILFLIGIQESGLGFRKYTREEKTDLILLGQKTVEKLGSGEAIAKDSTRIQPFTDSPAYNNNLKTSILHYFNNS